MAAKILHVLLNEFDSVREAQAHLAATVAGGRAFCATKEAAEVWIPVFASKGARFFWADIDVLNYVPRNGSSWLFSDAPCILYETIYD